MHMVVLIMMAMKFFTEELAVSSGSDIRSKLTYAARIRLETANTIAGK